MVWMQFIVVPRTKLKLHIEKASNLTAQTLTFQVIIKHHTTVKFLIAVFPTCGICYISQAWGCRVSDSA
jgi:hypothetical protein